MRKHSSFPLISHFRKTQNFKGIWSWYNYQRVAEVVLQLSCGTVSISDNQWPISVQKRKFIWASTPQFISVKTNPLHQKLIINQCKIICGLKIILVSESFLPSKISYSEFQTTKQIKVRFYLYKFPLQLTSYLLYSLAKPKFRTILK